MYAQQLNDVYSTVKLILVAMRKKKLGSMTKREQETTTKRKVDTLKVADTLIRGGRKCD